MRWGLVPSWAKDPSIGNRTIDARAETLAEKPSFKRLLGKRRSVIPADGFYEWRKEGKRKVPVWIHLANKDPFGFAGLWETWRKPEGATLGALPSSPVLLTSLGVCIGHWGHWAALGSSITIITFLTPPLVLC